MKRDLQLNYGVLDEIIEQLHTYKYSLQSMHDSLAEIAVFVRTNQGESIDAWSEIIDGTKLNMEDYQTQIEDLLSLFENYVADTTAYIPPVARSAMMRVDRNDIWANLDQIESGISGNVGKALTITYQSPGSIFGLFDDPTDSEKEASRRNKAKIDEIRNDIQATKTRLGNKMDALWDLYNSKVVKFENVDDAYNDKAAAVKDKYTNFFEGFWDVVSGVAEFAWDLVRGVAVGVYELAKGLVMIVGDIGVVALSGAIHDTIEPEWLKKRADTTIDTYAQAAKQLVTDPMRVVESIGQAVTDTAEQEGIAYIGGYGLTMFVPGAAVKGVRGVAALGRAAKVPEKLKAVVPYSKEFIDQKVLEAKVGMNLAWQRVGQVPAGFSPSMEMAGTGGLRMAESKKLSEVFPQLFAVKRVDGGDTGNTDQNNNIVQNYNNVDSITKEVLLTKPKNSPNPKKWIQKGGSISIDTDGTWIYHHKDGHFVRYNDGFPDFKEAGFVEQEVNIGEFKDYNSDFKKADENAPNGPRDAINNTWHHHQDGKTMQEVNKEIHKDYTHRGGMSLKKRNN